MGLAIKHKLECQCKIYKSSLKQNKGSTGEGWIWLEKIVLRRKYMRLNELDSFYAWEFGLGFVCVEPTIQSWMPFR